MTTKELELEKERLTDLFNSFMTAVRDEKTLDVLRKSILNVAELWAKRKI